MGGARDVDVSLVEQVVPGDLVLVHAGVALSTLGRSGPAGRDGRAHSLPLPLPRESTDDPTALLADLAGSARAKAAESEALRAGTLQENADTLGRAGRAMAERFAGGGGSSPSATGERHRRHGAVQLFRDPPHGGGCLPYP